MSCSAPLGNSVDVVGASRHLFGLEFLFREVSPSYAANATAQSLPGTADWPSNLGERTSPPRGRDSLRREKG